MALTLCPVALATGCRRCPIFSVCPLKSVIGDQPSAAADQAPQKAGKASGNAGTGKGSRKRN